MICSVPRRSNFCLHSFAITSAAHPQAWDAAVSRPLGSDGEAGPRPTPLGVEVGKFPVWPIAKQQAGIRRARSVRQKRDFVRAEHEFKREIFLVELENEHVGTGL